MNWPNRRPRGTWFSCILVVALAAMLGEAGCNTVTPVATKARQPSFDGTAQDSGFVGWQTNASNKVLYGILTSHARDRYNALCKAYGKRFTPALALDAGLTAIAPAPNGSAAADPRAAWLIDMQHLVYFETMNRWKKESVKP